MYKNRKSNLEYYFFEANEGNSRESSIFRVVVSLLGEGSCFSVLGAWSIRYLLGLLATYM